MTSEGVQADIVKSFSINKIGLIQEELHNMMLLIEDGSNYFTVSHMTASTVSSIMLICHDFALEIVMAAGNIHIK